MLRFVLFCLAVQLQVADAVDVCSVLTSVLCTDNNLRVSLE